MTPSLSQSLMLLEVPGCYWKCLVARSAQVQLLTQQWKQAIQLNDASAEDLKSRRAVRRSCSVTAGVAHVA